MPTTLLQSDLPGLPLRHRGKVRDVFDIPRERLPAGTPPGDYLLDWRLRRARLLLREGLGVAEVATAVGYGSAAALTRIFSQRLGQAPARWRREQAVRSRVSAQ